MGTHCTRWSYDSGAMASKWISWLRLCPCLSSLTESPNDRERKHECNEVDEREACVEKKDAGDTCHASLKWFFFCFFLTCLKLWRVIHEFTHQKKDTSSEWWTLRFCILCVSSFIAVRKMSKSSINVSQMTEPENPTGSPNWKSRRNSVFSCF